MLSLIIALTDPKLLVHYISWLLGDILMKALDIISGVGFHKKADDRTSIIENKNTFNSERQNAFKI